MNRSIDFFDTQFRKQVANRDFALNPFESAVLPFVRGRVLDLGCGLTKKEFSTVVARKP
jgi:tellurite methyltransferase